VRSSRAGYRLWLLVALVVVAHRRLGPSPSASTSTVERALPSSAVQVVMFSSLEGAGIGAAARGGRG
jgi:hypothetical protein